MESVSSALNEVRRLGYGQIASILRLGAYHSFSSQSSPLYEQVNVRGTERLLHGLRDFEVEQFLFASTMLVHQPLANFGAWLQNLVPGVEPFVKQ
jgi:nucleoside-diphosphate-sugar epimerase